ncbi:hypothetical protein N7447_000189 [Penicillium robsamsonii]|uniref:uncharacterized protein n=1 Tax=Penicillium robsamsonii TaxID=1792511 RepID=UPI002548E556|nr:uncharacterized protein N7447_000189 [Penicillium robsamsonii]KAJ5834163.1 hypothetical protein N7447_000189 [Penicillium robsamsonii]
MAKHTMTQPPVKGQYLQVGVGYRPENEATSYKAPVFPEQEREGKYWALWRPVDTGLVPDGDGL